MKELKDTTILTEDTDNNKPKRYLVIKKLQENAETGISRSKVYSSFDSLKDAVDYINHLPECIIGILDTDS